MSKEFELMGLMIYFGYIHLVDGGYTDLKAFEKYKGLKTVLDEFNNVELYKHQPISKLSSRSYLALRGCYRKKKLSSEEAYKKLKLVADRIGKDHLQFCINSTISLFYPDKKIPEKAYEEILEVNEMLGIEVEFDYKYLALEDLGKKAREKAREKLRRIQEEDAVEAGETKKVFVIGGVLIAVILIVIAFLML